MTMFREDAACPRAARRLAAIAVVSLVVAMVMAVATATAASAQSGWFERGRDILEGLGSAGESSAVTSDADIAAGLKEALRVGSGRVIDQVGRVDGFNTDSNIHIPLPGPLGKVSSALDRFGLGGLTDDLELRLNRAAEQAAPEARDLFVEAISDMTLDDARRIYDGPDDAATRYFRMQMSEPLAERMTPIVEESLADVGAGQRL